MVKHKVIITKKIKKSKNITNKPHKSNTLNTKNKPKTIQKKTKKSKHNLHNIYDDTYKTHKYNKYYPSILDPNFTNKITHHPVFKKYKLTINKTRLDDLYNAFETNTPLPEDTKKTASTIYILKATQKLLRNFMSPYTPYRNLLIYHEMGVGKTCTAITIAESLKSITQNSGTKIYIIRPDEIARQIFNILVVKDKKPLLQCTGDTYLQNDHPRFIELYDGCLTGSEQQCEQLKMRIEKDIKAIYEFTGSLSWASDISRKIEQKTRNIDNPVEEKHRIQQLISKLFDNSVIIVDEAHELREEINTGQNTDHFVYINGKEPEGKKLKKVPPILKRVLENSSNLRLIFLSATPIYDKPQNIISLINYFLINDKRPIMKEREIFDADGNLKSGGKEILINNTRGYVSFLRGSDPFIFPIRLSARVNIPNLMFNPSDYPAKSFFGKKIHKSDRIKYMDLVNCPMRGSQLDIIKYHMTNDKIEILTEEEITSLSSKDSILPEDLDETDYLSEINGNDDSNSDVDSKKSLIESKTSLTKGITLQKRRKSEKIQEQTVAYLMERQLCDFVYLSLEECNKNVKQATGDTGLSQIAKKKPNKWTYEFTDSKYAARFKLPELYNWGSKIARVVELIMKSTGPVFIYTYFNKAGVIPLAFALEMNGYKRYKQYENPLIESDKKDPTYRGDYIIYTGDAGLSQYARDYLDKGQFMKNEKNVKVFIGTSKASEGLNLFGYREVHILDPWHNINLIEQSIGRVIRTESHLHLPPQERNVVVYQHVATMPGQETADLLMYKICEDKAIKAGIVEKILKENAFDCQLNKARNIYDKDTYSRLIPIKTSHNIPIKVSLADAEYSRGCFYMKDCNFQCLGGTNTSDNTKYDMPVMRFNFDKEVYEYKNLIIQLLATNPNIKINNLKEYLMKLIYGNDTKTTQLMAKGIGTSTTADIWEDEEAFETAIQELVNMNVQMMDKFNRKGRIVISGEYLRFIPDGNISPNVSIQKQYLKMPILRKDIDLKGYIVRVNEDQKKIVEEQEFDYIDIVNNVIEDAEHYFYGVSEKFNVKTTMDDVIDIIFSKLTYSFKLTILRNYIKKFINNEKMTENEKKLDKSVFYHVVFIKDIFPDYINDSDMKKNIYGFIIAFDGKMDLFILNDDGKFDRNLGNLKKIVENKKKQIELTPNNNFFGYLKYEKDKDKPIFKIVDITKGDKKSVTGITCFTRNLNDIKRNVQQLDDKILKGNPVISKNALCNDIEILMKKYDNKKYNGKKWYYKAEDYYIYFGSSG